MCRLRTRKATPWVTRAESSAIKRINDTFPPHKHITTSQLRSRIAGCLLSFPNCCIHNKRSPSQFTCVVSLMAVQCAVHKLCEDSESGQEEGTKIKRRNAFAKSQQSDDRHTHITHKVYALEYIASRYLLLLASWVFLASGGTLYVCVADAQGPRRRDS